MTKAVVINGETLTINDVVAVARHNASVTISEEGETKIERTYDSLQRLLEQDQVIYGVTTGFGALGNVPIQPKDLKKLQVNLIRSHASGVGHPLSSETVRALMLLRANTLTKGHSGVRPETVKTLVQMINKGVHPIIPEKGSVGASGDLAPLSHMVLVMIGEGIAEFQGTILEGTEAMNQARISPITLEAKEGVALNNGTQMMTAIAALAVHDAQTLIDTAEVAAALSLEALCGIIDAFDKKIHDLKPHKGQMKSASNIRKLLAQSTLVESSQESAKKRGYPQDPYCLRCIPQVLGAVRTAIDHVEHIVQVEINSATDNPLVFPNDQECLSGGNFHGQPISLAMDYLATALATVGNFSERRTAMLLDERLSRGLPPFLISDQAAKGVCSGLMTAQYTAAALASENKSLAHPASADSIPTSANFEDFVSMGPIAARKTTEILRNTEYIVAIELLTATQGVDFRGAEKLGAGTRKAYRRLRQKVTPLEDDRVISKDIEAVLELIKQKRFIDLTR